ncbi:hypothetical protein Q2295_07490 [Leptospira interrogans]|uniref:Uncharacterized protein n=1 Tax=Leptospira interrogans serovar Pomona TaxID=44276 RepID=A0AA40WB44_LEPIR|nr:MULTISPECIES: hypothetical protein [Leptospira]EJO79437.1 hypothetical protein LEP1GSC045_2079 [Leptospira interrogans serovar Pomona str. Kennewicki LC82-25]EKN98050.1 hypothetical protein LEP1GSC014_1088 [Leptospira interrogans serovar Pomona str. Pomona]EMF31627.1 hypothetical protein LEP1GSC201_3912 [Leptospira interrogans serovar Pomona str. Fox 32256]EMI61819.1 hypothetical protein LEP1GSC200_4292 [Leptospira interrogans serovar Pomona str. CSL10083]EMJ58693.1 hypothetical protein LEP
MRKSFLKIGTPTILEFVRKIVICGSSHILGIEITTFFRKMNHGFPYVELTLLRWLTTALSASVNQVYERNIIQYFVFSYNLIDYTSTIFALDYIEST